MNTLLMLRSKFDINQISNLHLQSLTDFIEGGNSWICSSCFNYEKLTYK